ncbi:MAG: hypothetical protein JNK94_02555 [Hyphomonadaceae bacterium]|nr:hypothetical protein [Hyphomonadaceae bacterium]MBX3510002.1 hypothetical protein [Hyphomonadaceae bacterium]
MKVIVGAALAAVLLATPALAQQSGSDALPPPAATQCGAMPETPQLPDGANANRAAMVQANERFTAWVTASQTYLECVRHEADAAAATYQARRDEYNTKRDTLRTAVDSWTAETAEFNSRTTQGPSRTR